MSPIMKYAEPTNGYVSSDDDLSDVEPSEPIETIQPNIVFKCRDCGVNCNPINMVTIRRFGEQDKYGCLNCFEFSSGDETDDDGECKCGWCGEKATIALECDDEIFCSEEYGAEFPACQECGEGFLTDYPNHKNRRY